MNDEQRRGLEELTDWVASIKSQKSGDRVVEALAEQPAPTAPPTFHTDGEAGPSLLGSTDADAEAMTTGDDGQGATLVIDQVHSDGGGDGVDGVDGTDDEDEDEDEAASPPEKRRSAARTFVDWVLVVGIALFVALVIRTFVLAHFVVDGTSMANTLHNGDRVFVNKLSYRIGEPSRGDVVVLHQFGETGRDLIKRVVALEGETIEVRNCQVFIDGRPMEEPYLDSELVQPGHCGRDVSGVTVPDDHVFVMGDNRDGSQDSRNIGPVHEDDLVGRAFVVFWPAGNWKWL